MTDKYVDPHNWLEYTDRIREAKTLGDVKNIIDNIFPGLIIHTLPNFSQDYEILRRNWYQLCKTLNAEPKCIMIFADWNPDESHKLVAHIAECFTKAGFLVRTCTEIQRCDTCRLAIPTHEYHTLMTGKGIKLPEWSANCTDCLVCTK